MANEWREHVKKTMNQMKASAPKGTNRYVKRCFKSSKKNI